MPSTDPEPVFFDAGMFIGALTVGDSRHAEARPIVEAGRRGEIRAVTSPSVLSEVYGALTWMGAMPPQTPEDAALAMRSLIDPPSAIRVLTEDAEVILLTVELARQHSLTGRRIHDARHAAAALVAGITQIFTYDLEDWRAFVDNGITISGPPSVRGLSPR